MKQTQTLSKLLTMRTYWIIIRQNIGEALAALLILAGFLGLTVTYLFELSGVWYLCAGMAMIAGVMRHTSSLSTLDAESSNAGEIDGDVGDCD